MLLKYLDRLKSSMDKHSFLILVNAVEDDIKFNRIRFKKRTTPEEFIRLLEMTKEAVLRCQIN